MMKCLAWLISPHGRGHAARAAAIMSALRERDAAFEFEIYTRVEEAFFKESIGSGFRYHAVETDLGLVQDTPLEENIPATIQRLDALLPYDAKLVTSLADEIKRLGCMAVVCDIAPLGICVAREAGLPSVLVENFRWDWIYEGYRGKYPAIQGAVDYMRDLFAKADYHIQTAPITEIVDCDFTSDVVSRKPQRSRVQTRAALGIGSDEHVVLVSGGVPPDGGLMEGLARLQDLRIVVSGFGEAIAARSNVVSLPYESGYYHPDLMLASDAVVGKLGYSTVAEAYHAGLPYAYIARERFRESASLEAFVRDEMPCRRIESQAYLEGEWMASLHELAMLPAASRDKPNGADQVAEYLEKEVLA